MAEMLSATARESLRALARIFREQGRALYLVGGCVRDQLLGRPLTDYDLATDALPEETKALADRVKPDAVYTIGEEFGTIGLLFGQSRVEITTFRTEQYAPRSRWPSVGFGISLEEDLARRDFTINAMAQDLATEALIDPFQGVQDIQAHVIRAVGQPEARFREDPLRLLRGVRFAAQLGFVIEEKTAAAIQRGASQLADVSVERIQDELNKIMLSPHPGKGIRLACDLAIMELIIPEVLTLRGLAQDGWHHKDVYEHTLKVVDQTKADLPLRWSALLHDIGKPATRGFQKGEVHFFGHESVGERMAVQILNRLRAKKSLIEQVAKLVRMHLRPSQYDGTWTDGAVRRLIREAGEDLQRLFALSKADITSYRPHRVRAALAREQELEERVRQLLAAEEVARLSSPLDGHELMSLFQRPPGPWIRPVKEHLLNLVIEGELAPTDKERAAALAREFVAGQSNPT